MRQQHLGRRTDRRRCPGLGALGLLVVLAGGGAGTGCGGSAPGQAAAPPTSSPTPGQVDASLDAIDQYMQSEDLVSAEAIARRLTEQVPDDMRGHEVLARILLHRSILARDGGDEAEADALLRLAGERYDAAAACAPKTAGLRQSAGTVWMMASEPDRALVHFEAAAEMSPGDPQPPLYIAQILVGRGDHAGAERYVETVLGIEPGQPQALATLAIIRLEDGAFDDARSLIERARSVAPDDLAIRLHAARIQRRSGSPRRSLELLTALRPDLRADAGVTAELASSWEALDQPAEAARVWIHRFTLQPDWRAAASASGLLHRAGQLEEAVSWYDEARRLAPPGAAEIAKLKERLGR